jgi:uncharacterized 2Fe-2S/4Fe-4S cluster protein (DUF4445 family)
MLTLKILPLDKIVSAQVGTTLLDALSQSDIQLFTPCGGQGICGKCKVIVSGQTHPEETEHDELTQDEVADGYRLACRFVIREDLHIRLVGDYYLDTRILEGERISATVLKSCVRIEQTDHRYFLHYGDLAQAGPLANWGPECSPKGLAVDIGTTTLVVTLMDLRSGTEVGTASALNPQTRFGHDVLSRIQKASTGEGLHELGECIAASLNRLIKQVSTDFGSQPEEILDVVVGGNTAMLQIAAGIEPSSLGQVPFTVSIESGRTYPASRFGLQVNPSARAYVPPVAHAFVGSDISAGLLSTGFFEQTEPFLFMDIGTNGELAVNGAGKWIVTSTAAGPAFEGMGISQGVRATTGAIEMVQTDGKQIHVRTIDDAPATGICGSGIIDTLACLIELGGVDSSGRMVQPTEMEPLPGLLAERLEQRNGSPAFRLSNDIYFTQKDVRQVQLAKSAIQTGMQMLLEASGVQLEELREIVIAGAFGYHLRKRSMETIGIIPKGFSGKVVLAGNTCRTGGAMMLVDGSLRKTLERWMGGVTYLSIAQEPAFQELFIRNLSL